MTYKSNDWQKKAFCIKRPLDPSFTIVVSGRDRWALEWLMRKGSEGCTPIDTPGPRWSAYVFSLRELGVDIETLRERHAGPFPGTHARYVLRCGVSRADDGEVAA